jgi:NADH-quinone oxidoreductase subunit D
VSGFVDQLEEKLDEMERLLNGNRIFLERLEGIGVVSGEDALSLGLTGPTLRGSGVAYDLRRSAPYLFYDEIDFNVVTFKEGDSLARYFVRADEIRESMKIIKQVLDKMSPGEIMLNAPKKVLPKKTEIYTRMEELIHDFMLVHFGTNPPKGQIYHAVENPKGELGFHIVSEGDAHPWKMKIRSPSFVNLQSLPHLVKGHMISDVIAIIGSIDPVMGEADK